MVRNQLLNNKSITYELFFACFLSWFAISGAVLGITKNVLHIGKIDTLLLYGGMLLMFLYVFGVFFKRLQGWQLASSIGVFTLLLIAMLFSSVPEANQGVIVDVVVFCIPCFLLAGCVRDFSSVYKYLLLIMQIAPYFHILSFLFLDSGQLDEDEAYSQSMSYRYLFPAIVLLSDVLSRFSFKSLIPFVICLFLIIAYGARGPLASLFLFAVLYWLVMFRNIGIKKLILPILLFAALAIYVITHFEQVIDYLVNQMSSLNSSVRIFQMVMDESVVEDEARGNYAAQCLKRVMENPFWGTGPVNDRVYLWNIYHSDRGVASMYPHNFFVEILTQFGLFFGIVLIAVFLHNIYKSLKETANIETLKLLLVFIGAYFFPLMFSGSYIETKGFYILIAFCFVVRSFGKVKLLRYVH